MPRTRKDVWSLTNDEGDWPEVLAAYERAVELLWDRDPGPGPPTDQRGWRFLAAMHGLARADGRPDTSNPLWCNCQHGSWYFLPWHRMYLLAFELIVQEVLDDAEWSLPYWYAVNPDDPGASVLPPAFRDTTKNLYTERRSFPANGGEPLPDLSMTLLEALVASPFSTDVGTSTFGGGERSDPSFNGEEVGLLEDTPHGGVHVLVGNDYDASGRPVRRGWMGSPYAAALDPIFWLHHANIDRLWQVWREYDESHQNPPPGDPAWTETTFSFPSADGGLRSWSVGEVLETTDLGYEYDNTKPPSALPPPVVAVPAGLDVEPEEAAVPEPPPPQVIGATQDVPLGTTDAVDVELGQPVDVGLAPGAEEDEGAAGRVYLRLEGVTGTAAAPVYDIYLNVPSGASPAEHPELRAGSLSTFRLQEASESNDVHDGSGLTAVYDITQVRDALEEQGRWNPERVQVTFSPVAPVQPAGLAEETAEEGEEPDVRASQIVVMVG